jgi:hypothetical protein
MSDKSAKSINEGIQATTVKAEVLAVGRGATAIKQSAAYEQALVASLDRLNAAVEALNLPPHARQALDDDLRGLRTIAEEGGTDQVDRAASTLQNFVGKLKVLGVVVSQAVGIAKPIFDLAELLRVPLGKLGI